jgi:predicted enzyme related to lactoylglutathione lyase
MRVEHWSTTFIVPKVEEVRSFYDQYFTTWYPFDCGWYVLIRLGEHADAPEIGFMEPRNGGSTSYSGGAMLNLEVEQVDEVHDKMASAGESIVIPLADNPWGDRGFGVLDPAGIVVYCHRPIPPAPEFRQFIQKSPGAQRGA